MRGVRIKSFILCLLIINGCGRRQTTVEPVHLIQSGEPNVIVRGISKEQAVTIANSDALKDFKDLANFSIVVCEQPLFWRIIYDGGGPEYVIDKTSARILRKQNIPQGLTERSNTIGTSIKAITAEDAISIAKNDARKTFFGGRTEDLDTFTESACQLAKAWRIIFDVRLTLESGKGTPVIPFARTPKYVISKRTGEVLYRELD